MSNTLAAIIWFGSGLVSSAIWIFMNRCIFESFLAIPIKEYLWALFAFMLGPIVLAIYVLVFGLVFISNYISFPRIDRFFSKIKLKLDQPIGKKYRNKE